MKALLLLISLLLTIGCSSELDRCMDKKAEAFGKDSYKDLSKDTQRWLENDCNKQGIY